MASIFGTERWYDCSYDLNRGILSTTYDINNRPRSIRFSSGARTDYLYDASGTKLRTIHTIPSVPPAVPMEGCTDEESIVSTTDYSGGYIYENGTVDRLLTTNGFVTFATDGTPAYHYYLKDYLGNVRAVISHDGSVEQTAHYYPFGSLMATTEYQPEVTHPNRHLYGGKELDRTSGLDLLDFEARAYDPILPRFRSMDYRSESTYHISPYVYCEDNPLKHIDSDGNQCIPIVGMNPIVVSQGTPLIMAGRTPPVSTASRISTPEAVRAVPKTEQHHIIPRALKKLSIVKEAIKEGFKFDGAENKITLEKYFRTTNSGRHANHPQYTESVAKALRDVASEEGTALSKVLKVVNQARNAIENNPGKKVNDIRLQQVAPIDNLKVNNPIILNLPKKYNQ